MYVEYRILTVFFIFSIVLKQNVYFTSFVLCTCLNGYRFKDEIYIIFENSFLLFMLVERVACSSSLCLIFYTEISPFNSFAFLRGAMFPRGTFKFCTLKFLEMKLESEHFPSSPKVNTCWPFELSRVVRREPGYLKRITILNMSNDHLKICGQIRGCLKLFYFCPLLFRQSIFLLFRSKVGLFYFHTRAWAHNITIFMASPPFLP